MPADWLALGAVDGRIHNMDLQAQSSNPFKPEGGIPPPLLAGRDEETGLLMDVIARLRRSGIERCCMPDRPPPPLVKLEGLRGMGKTALLNLAKEQAKVWGVRCVSCEVPAQGASTGFLVKLMEAVASGLAKEAIGFVASSPGSDMKEKLAQEGLSYRGVLREEVRKEPLLLLLDEVQRLDPPVLRAVVKAGVRLIGSGEPLGMVLAGAPGFSQDQGRSLGRDIYIGELSDKATREALWLPFECKGVPVTPAALEAMAAQTDNFPFFIQLVGQEVWNAMEKAGCKDINAKLVLQAEGKVRKGRENLNSTLAS